MSTSRSRTSNRSSILNSTFNWQQGNMKELLKPVDFYITYQNDYSEPFCHYTHKNLKWKEAPFLPQSFQITLDKLTSVKYIKIKNFTHGSEMTVSISQEETGPFVEVYEDKFICKGKSLKGEQKNIDIGALPCRAIKISVTKGCKLSSHNISIVGVDVNKIDEKLGAQYFKLLVINPMKIIYPE